MWKGLTTFGCRCGWMDGVMVWYGGDMIARPLSLTNGINNKQKHPKTNYGGDDDDEDDDGAEL